jgi:hypothetical protein
VLVGAGTVLNLWKAKDGYYHRLILTLAFLLFRFMPILLAITLFLRYCLPPYSDKESALRRTGVCDGFGYFASFCL